MNPTKQIWIFAFIAFAWNIAHAAKPVTAKNFINHSDWNFVENKGQLADENGNILKDIKYYGHQGGVNIYCKPGEISFVFTKNENTQNAISEATGMGMESPFTKGAGGFGQLKHEISQPSKTTISRTDLILLNSNPSAHILATDQQEYYENFYTTPNKSGQAGDADHGITNVHTYKTITYKWIYPNIDLVLHAKPNGVKYEFVVYPGGKVSDIQMQWNGLEGIKKLKDSKIEYSLALGKMDESKPVSFQGKNIVASDFEKHYNIVGFKVNRYDKSQTLVIDPTLIWGTYLGGSGDDIGYCVATDTFGDVYITGNTTSTSGIATQGAFQTLNGNGTWGPGYPDAFLAKFNSSGTRQWATYYGGNGVAEGSCVAVDNIGNVYITGNAFGYSGIATAGAYQTSLITLGTLDGNAFLVKFNSSGLRQWGTYYGIASGSGVATDANRNVYLTGTAESSAGIATVGAYQSSLAGYYNAYLAKFNSVGVRQWATYFGGTVEDFGTGVATDFSGNIYITGNTSSSSGIATVGGYQTSFGSNGTYHAFLAKFTDNGSLDWATYYGGNDTDNGLGVSTDGSGNVYITGATWSSSGIATSGAYKTAYGGSGDGFLAKFNSSGKRSWATYFGGSGADQCNGITSDGSGNLYITGQTASTSGITTSGAYQTSFGGNSDVFLAKFNSGGTLTWATYYGGNNNDIGQGISTDRFGNIYITGETASISDIATSGAFQTAFGGNQDAFIAKFGIKNKADIGIDSIISPARNSCVKSSFIVINLKNYGTDTLNSVSIISSINGKLQAPYFWSGNLYPHSTIMVNIGADTFSLGTDTLKIWISDPNGGIDSITANDTATTVIHVHSLPPANAGPDTTLCYNETYTMQGSGGVTYTWHPATYLSSATDPNAIAILPNTEHYELIVQNTFGCIDSAPVLLKVRPKLKLKAFTLNNPVCYGKDAILYGIGSGGDSLHYKYQWVNDGATGDSITEKGIQSGWHKVILSDNCTPDSVTDSIYITVTPPAKADFTFGQSQKIKINQKTDFLNQSANASSYLWTFGTKDSSKLVSPVYIYTDSGEYKIELIAFGIDGCPNDTTYKIIKIIGNLVTIYIPNAFSPNGDGTNDVFDISGIGIQSYSYNIYNRWGEHIFEAFQGRTAWDGKFKGQPVMEGVYIYQLDVIDLEGQHHYLSGNISLMR